MHFFLYKKELEEFIFYYSIIECSDIMVNEVAGNCYAPCHVFRVLIHIILSLHYAEVLLKGIIVQTMHKICYSY